MDLTSLLPHPPLLPPKHQHLLRTLRPRHHLLLPTRRLLSFRFQLLRDLDRRREHGFHLHEGVVAFAFGVDG